MRYGWESKNFYRKWFGGNNELEEYFPGAVIDPLQGPLTPMTQEFLDLFRHIIDIDKQYAKRIETHYKLFKEKIDKKSSKQAPITNANRNAAGQKIRRNDSMSLLKWKKI